MIRYFFTFGRILWLSLLCSIFRIIYISCVEDDENHNASHLLPKSDGNVRAAGPGPWNSAAIGPRRFVGVQLPLWPPILVDQ